MFGRKDVEIDRKKNIYIQIVFDKMLSVTNNWLHEE